MKRYVKIGSVVLAVALAAIGVAPFLNADQYGLRLKWALQRALGRQVDIGKVHFSLLNGPAFSVERNENGPGVVIHEDPTIGIEPIAYVETMEVRPSLWGLLKGRFVIASIRLEDASINLSKTGPASEWGRWNFASFVNPSVMSTAPAIHVRDGRIHFKFGDTKSVFYLTETDLDISPPNRRGGGWRVACSGKAARTDRSAQGLGSFALSGRWYVSPERVDMDLQLDRTGLGELTALLRGQAGSIHGTITSRLHLGGPIHNIGIHGRLTLEDVHRWDLLPPHGQGWPLDVSGRLDLIGQQVELQSWTAGNAAPPLSAHFRLGDYLSRPRWAVAVNWNRFAVEPLMQLATDMGAQFPAKLKVTGSMDGAIGYSGEGSFQGTLGFHDTAVTIPDSPPVGFERAYVVFDRRHVRLSPAVVRTSNQDTAEVEADFTMDQGTLDLSIRSEGMKVESLRSQVALAAVPWLEQVKSGQWSGDLHYRYAPEKTGWSGQLQLTDALIPVPGLADPVHLASARAQIDGFRVVLDRLDGQAGKLPFAGDYRYEPASARPHKIRLRIPEADAEDLEEELLPTLRRSSSLIARALGRASLPEWLKERSVDGSLQIDDLMLGGEHVEKLRSRLLWDVAHVELDGLQANVGRAAIAGKLSINLRGQLPAYKLTGKVKGLDWQSGKMDAEGTLETSGTGRQLLTNLTSQGEFTGAALDFGTLSPWRTVSGSYTLGCSPRLHLSELSVRTEDEIYTGKGGAQDNGQLVIQLSNGNKQMRMVGTLARLRVDESTRP